MPLLSLDSPLWSELRHACGDASNIPELLRALEASPSLDVDGESEEVWHDLWEALCRDDAEIGTASYAALPHIYRIALRADANSVGLYLHFLTCVESVRLQGKGPSIPDYLESAYFDTIANVPERIFSLSKGKWDYLLCTAAVAALAVSKGHRDLAWVISEMSPDNLRRTKSMLKSSY